MGSNLSINGKKGVDEKSLIAPTQLKPTPFGKEMAKHFLFDPKWKNMNHGSFGTYPLPVKQRLREFHDKTESQPDLFIRYTFNDLLDKSRAAIAKVLNAPIDTVVFVPNATTGVNTVLRNLVVRMSFDYSSHSFQFHKR
jgi:selenocysteine lyase/cysteine desulfurase